MSGAQPVPAVPIPTSAHLKVEYSDNFDGYVEQTPVRYFADEGGSFNAAIDHSNASNGVLEQAVPEKPVHGAWWDDGEPWTVMGDSQSLTWGNYTVAVLGRIDGPATSPVQPTPSPTTTTGITIVQTSAASPAHGQCLNVVGQSTMDGTGIMAYACGELNSTAPTSTSLLKLVRSLVIMTALR
jgi:hypothetical protein